MASIRTEILTGAKPESVWAAIRDIGALQQGLQRIAVALAGHRNADADRDSQLVALPLQNERLLGHARLRREGAIPVRVRQAGHFARDNRRFPGIAGGPHLGLVVAEDLALLGIEVDIQIIASPVDTRCDADDLDAPDAAACGRARRHAEEHRE